MESLGSILLIYPRSVYANVFVVPISMRGKDCVYDEHRTNEISPLWVPYFNQPMSTDPIPPKCHLPVTRTFCELKHVECTILF